MSLIQLYTDSSKTKKAHPKTVTSAITTDDGKTLEEYISTLAKPNIQIGTVEFVGNEEAGVTIDGEYPNIVFNFKFPSSISGGSGGGQTPGDTPTPTKKTKYLGLISHKDINSITLEDLTPLEIESVTPPTVVYAHSSGLMGKKALVFAFPKGEYTITSVVDGSGIDISSKYPVITKTIDGVEYTITATLEPSLWNNSTVIKFNII